jgi:hypothetical protein
VQETELGHIFRTFRGKAPDVGGDSGNYFFANS